MSDQILNPIVEPALQQSASIDTESKIPQRNFWLAMGAQLILLATIPARSLYAIATGTTVYLETAPVDPYDLLRGYYQTLSYNISNRSQLEKLPGGEMLKSRNYNPDRREIYVTLALPKDGRSAAKPVAISNQKPNNLPSDRIAIRGVSDGWQIRYDLEKFYMPETQADTVNKEISGNRRNLLVEVKVDSGGHPTLVGLWIGDKKYNF